MDMAMFVEAREPFQGSTCRLNGSVLGRLVWCAAMMGCGEEAVLKSEQSTATAPAFAPTTASEKAVLPGTGTEGAGAEDEEKAGERAGAKARGEGEERAGEQAREKMDEKGAPIAKATDAPGDPERRTGNAKRKRGRAAQRRLTIHRSK